MSDDEQLYTGTRKMICATMRFTVRTYSTNIYVSSGGNPVGEIDCNSKTHAPGRNVHCVSFSI